MQINIDYTMVMEIGYYNYEYGIYAVVIDGQEDIISTYYSPVEYDGDISKSGLESLILESAYIYFLRRVNKNFEHKFIGSPATGAITSTNNNCSNSDMQYVLNEITIISSIKNILNHLKNHYFVYNDLKLRADELLDKFKPRISAQLIDEPDIENLIKQANKKGVE